MIQRKCKYELLWMTPDDIWFYTNYWSPWQVNAVIKVTSNREHHPIILFANKVCVQWEWWQSLKTCMRVCVRLCINVDHIGLEWVIHSTSKTDGTLWLTGSTQQIIQCIFPLWPRMNASVTTKDFHMFWKVFYNEKCKLYNIHFTARDVSLNVMANICNNNDKSALGNKRLFGNYYGS